MVLVQTNARYADHTYVLVALSSLVYASHILSDISLVYSNFTPHDVHRTFYRTFQIHAYTSYPSYEICICWICGFSLYHLMATPQSQVPPTHVFYYTQIFPFQKASLDYLSLSQFFLLSSLIYPHLLLLEVSFQASQMALVLAHNVEQVRLVCLL